MATATLCEQSLDRFLQRRDILRELRDRLVAITDSGFPLCQSLFERFGFELQFAQRH
ncbi:MAG TPA: hypothetical protein VF384_03410 [Planctomycetota bacterium]